MSRSTWGCDGERFLDISGIEHWDDDSKWVDPNKRNEKWTHPYSYSEFFHFGSRRIVEGRGVDGEYSDRIWQWDYDKAERLWKEHVGTRWELAGAKKLSAFLSAFHGRPVRVVALAEGCNISNGYPYFIVWRVDASKKEAKR